MKNDSIFWIRYSDQFVLTLLSLRKTLMTYQKAEQTFTTPMHESQQIRALQRTQLKSLQMVVLTLTVTLMLSVLLLLSMSI